MFYKRISDLHPLGKPHTPNDWSDIDPFQIPNPGYFNEIDPNTSTIDYDLPTSPRVAHPANPPELPALKTAFNNKFWYNTTEGDIDYSNPTITKHPEQGTDPQHPTELSSEYYAKALWFEVAIQKSAQNIPTSNPANTQKYQSKRLNAYTMMMNLDEISANTISSQYMDVKNLYSNYISSNVIIANDIGTDTITSQYGYISSISSHSITADAISSSLGIINQISGINLWYQDANFTNITVTGTADLSAEAAYWADVAELYTADDEYIYGTLVKFGGEQEITIADDKANAVISENPAITMNSGNKDVNALPIVLTGRSKVRTIHPVKKFDKIYLSETPGVGCSSYYKISSAITPIGIALENKPSDGEGLVECILQLNFE